MSVESYLRSAYDRSAAMYDERFRALQYPKYEALFGERGALLAKRRPCLDLGCGTGLLGEWLRLQGQETDGLMGVDLSDEMLMHARKRGLSGLQADAAALPFVDEAFRAVVSVTVLGLFGSGREEAILAEAARVVVPGGLMVFSVLERWSGPHLVEAMQRQGIHVERELPCGQDVGYLARRAG